MATADCLYTQTQCSGPRLPTPLCKAAPLHMSPLIYLEYCTLQDLVYCFLTTVTVDVMFVCASHSSKWIPCQRIPRKVIWSWFADLADMECITFLEFREENQLSNTNQIYFPSVFIQKVFIIVAYLMILTEILRTTMQSPIFSGSKRRCSI